MSDRAERDGDAGGDAASHVVTAFLRNRGEVLLLCRSDAVSTYAGRWGGVSGFAEGDPDEQVRVEIREETGLEPDDDLSLVRSGRPVRFEDLDLGREWVVHPYLFDANSREVDLSEEHDALEWVTPTEICLDGDADDVNAEDEDADDDADRETVPELWTAYERVAPTVRSIAADDEHGAAYLSIRALEVVRDRAGLLVAEREATTHPNGDRGTREYGADSDGGWDELTELAGRLLEARPSMAVLRNRINRAMSEAVDAAPDGESVPGALAVLESTIAGIERAVAADTDAAAAAGERIDGTVATLSRSGTVLEALRGGNPSRVFVAESRPAREGIDVAEELVEDDAIDCPVTVHTDAAAAHVLSREEIDRVVIGADTVLHDGSVVNKTGTRALALAAAHEGIPVTVVAATDKLSTREEVNLESGSRSAVYDGDASLDVVNPTFDVTPAACVSEIVTERGSLEAGEAQSVRESRCDSRSPAEVQSTSADASEHRVARDSKRPSDHASGSSTRKQTGSETTREADDVGSVVEELRGLEDWRDR